MEETNKNLAAGTRIQFVNARLRAIIDGKMTQEALHLGVEVPNTKEGSVIGRVVSANGSVGYVVSTDDNMYGWVYAFEVLPKR